MLLLVAIFLVTEGSTVSARGRAGVGVELEGARLHTDPTPTLYLYLYLYPYSCREPYAGISLLHTFVLGTHGANPVRVRYGLGVSIRVIID